ncbi:MAG: MmcQ/YjbR family DNA-binding protein [Gemmatimonadaceae bacterium]
MSTEADVRRIALALPDTEEATNDFAFSVAVGDTRKGFAWCWKERVVPKKPRVPNRAVLALRVANNLEKDLMMHAEPDKYVVDPHYNGFPAVLVRLAKVRVPELRALLTEAHRCVSAAPKRKRRVRP